MSVLHELAEASRRGKITVLRADNTRLSISRGTDWDMPSFDFGNLSFTDPSGPPKFDSATMDALEARAHEIRNSGFVLPFPRCAFITRDANSISVDVWEIKESKIIHANYYRPISLSDAWVMSPYVFHFNIGFDRGTSNFYYISGDEFSSQIAPIGASLDKLAWETVNEILFLLATLSMPTTERETISTDFAANVNRGREKGKLAPIPEAVAIRLNPVRNGSSRLGKGIGAPRCPHDRRAHVRRLRSGKVIPVRSCSIHGGGDGTRQYRIIA